MPRKPIGETAMTPAERQRRRRQAIIETTPAPPRISKAEAVELQKLINRREKVLKQVAAARSAELLADFERQMSAIYSFDDREIWAEATRRGQTAVNQANEIIAEECARLGIPSIFAPRLDFSWLGRGQNGTRERRDELRRLAKASIDAIEQRALVEISREALLASTEVVALGLVSDAAQRFLHELAPLERLMPPLDFHGVEETLIGKPMRNRYGEPSGTYQRLAVGAAETPDDRDEN